MLLEHLELYAMGIRKPKRVLIKPEPAHAVSLRRAALLGVGYDMILVRHDGWSLGFKYEWRDAACAMWPNHWIAVCDLRDQVVYRLAPNLPEGNP